MQLFNKSKSNTPRLNKTQSRSGSRSGQLKEIATNLDKQNCQVSTIEFEAKNKDSSFSTDSDFDRNMDEMESDLMNEHIGGKVIAG